MLSTATLRMVQAADDALDTSVTNDIAPKVVLEYFFTKNFSAELIAGFTHHDIKTVNGYPGSTRWPA